MCPPCRARRQSSLEAGIIERPLGTGLLHITTENLVRWDRRGRRGRRGLLREGSQGSRQALAPGRMPAVPGRDTRIGDGSRLPVDLVPHSFSLSRPNGGTKKRMGKGRERRVILIPSHTTLEV